MFGFWYFFFAPPVFRLPCKGRHAQLPSAIITQSTDLSCLFALLQLAAVTSPAFMSRPKFDCTLQPFTTWNWMIKASTTSFCLLLLLLLLWLSSIYFILCPNLHISCRSVVTPVAEGSLRFLNDSAVRIIHGLPSFCSESCWSHFMKAAVGGWMLQTQHSKEADVGDLKGIHCREMFFFKCTCLFLTQ